VSPRYPPYLGGIETHVSELAGRMNDRFDRVSVVTTDPQRHLPTRQHVRDGFDIYRIKSFAPGENYHFPWVPSLIKRLRECHSDILHLHGIQDVPGPVASVFDHESASVFTPHFSGQVQSGLGKFIFAGYRPLLNQLIDRVSFVICVSRFEARTMSEILPDSAEKIRIIPNGVDSSLLSKYRWHRPDTGAILYAGRLEKHKNVDKIIRAFQNLQREDDQLSLTVVGRGPMKDELVSLAKELGLESKVRWIDGVGKERLYSLYSSCSVVVLPSDLECFGLVAAEAISLGVPTIVTDSSALSDFVDNGLAQPVEPPVSPGKLESKLSQVLEDPAAFSPGKDSSGTILSWDEVANQTCDLYESAMKR
jgi:glycosyltransferase involved in cell wall biosynthesis